MYSTHMEGGRASVNASFLDQPHHQKCGAVEECAVNVAELSVTGWGRHSHHLSRKHTLHTDSVRDGFIHVQLRHSRKSCFVPASISACLPWYFL